MTMSKNPFEIEKLRERLATKKDFKLFKNTYTSKYPVIKDLNTPVFWDHLNDRHHIENNDSPMTNHKIRVIANKIPNSKIKVLNIGCGSGDLENIVFNVMEKNNIDWYGVDISPKSVKSCKNEFAKSHFSLGDIRKLKFKKNEFDLIILMEIMEHIKPTETYKALREVERVLKPGGKLIVSIPINEGLEDLIKGGQNPNAHVRAYTVNIIKRELEISGFKVNKVVELFAFKRMYWPKTFVAKYIFKDIKKPNGLILFAEKN